MNLKDHHWDHRGEDEGVYSHGGRILSLWCSGTRHDNLHNLNESLLIQCRTSVTQLDSVDSFGLSDVVYFLLHTFFHLVKAWYLDFPQCTNLQVTRKVWGGGWFSLRTLASTRTPEFFTSKLKHPNTSSSVEEEERRSATLHHSCSTGNGDISSFQNINGK